jgi:hypothetical protein
VRIFAPLRQSCEDLIEDYHARHNRRAGKMPGQAGMIRADLTANFEAHAMKLGSSDQIEQPDESVVQRVSVAAICNRRIILGIIITEVFQNVD